MSCVNKSVAKYSFIQVPHVSPLKVCALSSCSLHACTQEIGFGGVRLCQADLDTNKEGGPAKVDGDLNLLGKPWKTQSRASLEHVHVAIHAGLGQHPWSAGNPSLNKYVQCKSAKASAAATV